MNRRRVLEATGALAVTGLSGCLGAFQDHFQGELRSPVPIEIHNEGERPYQVQLEAYQRGTDRQTYDEPLTITSGQQVKPPNLEGIEQRFQVTRFGGDDADDLVETGVIAPDTQLVHIVIDDDDLQLEIRKRETSDGNETDGNESAANGSETDGDE